MKIVINKCYGGFGLSALAVKRYLELKGKECYFIDIIKFGKERKEIIITLEEAINLDSVCVYTDSALLNESYFSDTEIERNDPDLVKVIEELGDKANNNYSELNIVEIPDGTKYYIGEYDGIESIHEQHESWD